MRTRLEAKSDSEAIDYLFAALKFFLLKHTKKTLIALVIVFGGAGYILFDYMNTQKAKLMDAKPIEAVKPIGDNLSLFDRAYAQEKPENPIWIHGNVYGFADTTFIIWKLKDQAAILVWNKKANAIFKVEIPALGDQEQMKKYAK